MATTIEELSLNYEEDGILLVKEIDKEVLAWLKQAYDIA